MSKYYPPLIFEQHARNGDRITVSHPPNQPPNRAFIVLVNGSRVGEYRTKDGAMREATALLAARQHA